MVRTKREPLATPSSERAEIDLTPNQSLEKAEEKDSAAKPNRHDDVETRLAQVTGLADELQRRLSLLEEAVYSRDRELAELRAALQGRERRDEHELAMLSSRLEQAGSRATMGTRSRLGAGGLSPIEFTPPSSPERQRTRSGTRSRSADSSSFDRVQLESRFSVSPRSSWVGLLEAAVEVDAEVSPDGSRAASIILADLLVLHAVPRQAPCHLQRPARVVDPSAEGYDRDR